MDSLETPADVVAWAVREGLRISEVVVQDEYSHDGVVVGVPMVARRCSRRRDSAG
jgi:hypothetical protein